MHEVLTGKNVITNKSTAPSLLAAMHQTSAEMHLLAAMDVICFLYLHFQCINTLFMNGKLRFISYQQSNYQKET
jgi:hypothetical protein